MEQNEYIVETVRVVSPITDGNPHGYVVINKSDASAEHVMFSDSDEVESELPVEQSKPARRGRPPKVREPH